MFINNLTTLLIKVVLKFPPGVEMITTFWTIAVFLYASLF